MYLTKMRQLFPHQEFAAKQMAGGIDAFWLCDEPGLGKSASVIMSLVLDFSPHWLWITPLSACGVVKREVELWAPGFWNTHILRRRAGLDDIPRETQGLIVPWSLLQNRKLMAPLREFARLCHTVIIDESHYAKNPETLRTRQVLGLRLSKLDGLIEGVPCVRFLTGTPISSHAGEIYPQLKACAPWAIDDTPTYETYKARYTKTQTVNYGGRMIESIKGTKLDPFAKLANRIAPFFLMRQAAHVIMDLPELRWQIVEMDGGAYAEAFNREIASGKSRLGFAYGHLFFAEHDLQRNPDSPTSQARYAMAADAAAIAYDHAGSTLRRVVGMAKAAFTAEYVGELLRGGRKRVIVFAHHQTVIDELQLKIADQRTLRETSHKQQYISTAAISGITHYGVRDTITREWQQSDCKIRVLVLQMDAAGEALTLHAYGDCTDVVFAEYPSNPDKLIQCAKRVHRIGQPNLVIAHCIAMADTLDTSILVGLVRKLETMQTFNEGVAQERNVNGTNLAAALAERELNKLIDFPDF